MLQFSDMPELPEVETVVRCLAPVLTGRRVRRLEIFDSKLTIRSRQLPRSRVIHDVFRRGKEIVIDLSRKTKPQKPLWLCVHLRMTGRLIWSKSSSSSDDHHLRARIILDQGNLLFIDSRRFGIMRLLTCLDNAFAGGIDPLSPEFTDAKLTGLLFRGNQEIKPWLLRQDRLVGLGNIYASEILFAARLHPGRPGGSLTRTEIKRLHGNTRRLLKRAIKYCGTTIADFQDGNGQSGRFQRFLKVYGREGAPCRRCTRPIEKITQQGRSTFFCPACQSRDGRMQT
jgi:formamidopyrimidine-DNA glycosylase